MADILPRSPVNLPRRGPDVTPMSAPTSPAPTPPALPAASAPHSTPAPGAPEVVELSPPPAKDLENRLRDILNSEGLERDRAPNLVSLAGSPMGDGLLVARHDLEQRAREGAKMVRTVDRHRQQLERAEADLEALQEKLSSLLPTVTEAANALKSAIRQTRRGDEVQSLSDQFNRSNTTLDDLESLAGNLSAQLLWTRSAWEQYCKTIVAAQRMRSDHSAS